MKEDSVEHGKLVSAMTKERLTLEEKVTELTSALEEVYYTDPRHWETFAGQLVT